MPSTCLTCVTSERWYSDWFNPFIIVPRMLFPWSINIIRCLSKAWQQLQSRALAWISYAIFFSLSWGPKKLPVNLIIPHTANMYCTRRLVQYRIILVKQPSGKVSTTPPPLSVSGSSWMDEIQLRCLQFKHVEKVCCWGFFFFSSRRKHVKNQNQDNPLFVSHANWRSRRCSIRTLMTRWLTYITVTTEKHASCYYYYHYYYYNYRDWSRAHVHPYNLTLSPL